MKRILVTFFFILIVAGCTTLSVGPEEEDRCGPRPSYDDASRAAQVYVDRYGFKDPTSAQIRDIQIGNRAKWYRGVVNGGGYNYGWEITFNVNAKNSFGGYVGYKSRTVLLSPGDNVQWRYEVE